MIKKKDIQTICLSGVFSLLLMTAQTARADVFLHPEQNAYSLSKTAKRPFLQSVPIPQVWQTDLSSDSFKKALLNVLFPQTEQERHFDALTHENDSADVLYDFQSIFLSNRQENEAIADTLSDVGKIIEKGTASVARDIEELSDKSDAFFEDIRKADVSAWKKRFSDLVIFSYILNDMARITAEVDILEEDGKKNEFRGWEKLSVLSEKFLERAGDIYSAESHGGQEMLDADNMFSSLLIDDALDVSTSVNVLLYDDAFPVNEKVKNLNRSASLLDRKQKTAQIQGDSFLESRKALVDYIKGKMKNGTEKDVK